MSWRDLALNRAFPLGWKVVASLALALVLAGPANAEPVQLDWSIVHVDETGADPFWRGYFIVTVDLRLGQGWNLLSFDLDEQPTNLLGEQLDFRLARYGYTPFTSASDGGYGGGIIGNFIAAPGTHAGVFDRVILPDGSSRPSTFRVAANYMGSDPAYEFDSYHSWTFDFSVTLFESADFPVIVPEPASIASASLAALLVGGFLGRQRLRRRLISPG